MTLYVGNLAYRTTEQELTELVAEIAAVKTVQLLPDAEAGDTKGFGYVELVDPEDEERVVQQLHDQSVRGRAIVVSRAVSRS